jgi:hypothetical protein
MEKVIPDDVIGFIDQFVHAPRCDNCHVIHFCHDHCQPCYWLEGYHAWTGDRYCKDCTDDLTAEGQPILSSRWPPLPTVGTLVDTSREN